MSTMVNSCAFLPGQTAVAARRLRASMPATVLVAGNPDYDAARRLWNGAVDRRPAVVAAHCADEQDVAAAVRAARESDLRLSVRGGGHDWAGRALRDDGLPVVSTMRAVTVDAATRTALTGMRKLLVALFTTLPDFHFTLKGAWGEGDRIAWRGTMRGTMTGPLGEVPATGRSMTGSIGAFFQMADGKIQKAWTFVDSPGAMQQLGLVPGPGAP
jgi:predicted ester cyclase